MENEFIPYEQALALKELGFDEPCFGATFTYNSKINDYITFCGQSNYSGYKNSEGEEVRKLLKDEYYISRPTFPQAFRWFREKYSLFGYVMDNMETSAYYWGVCKSFSGETIEDSSENAYQSYKEARLECLKKLIELCKKH